MFTLGDWMTLQKWHFGICLVLLLIFRKQLQAFHERFASKAESEGGRFGREILMDFIGFGFIVWPMILFFILDVL